MILEIVRFATGDDGTQGRAELSGAVWCSGELPWRDNTPLRSCVPAGSYRAALLYSPRFAAPLYHLLEVPGRSEILLHQGNWFGDIDKGYKSDTEGCILVGHQLGKIPGCDQLALIMSRAALSEIMAVTAGQGLDIEVKWVEGVSPE